MLDKNIVEGLFRQHYGKMLHLAGILLADDAEAQDVVQDVFARLMEQDYQMAGSKVEAYLMSAVRNRCFNAIRKKNVSQRVREMLPIEDDDLQPIEQQMDELERIHAFVDKRFKEPYRSVFNLRFDEDLTLKEISARLNLSIGAVYKYLNQGIQRIRIQFNND